PEVLERDPAAAGHQEEGAASGQRRQRIANAGRERPHDPVPQPEQGRQDHQRRADSAATGGVPARAGAWPSPAVPAINASVNWWATPSVYWVGGDFMKYDEG